MRSGLRHLMLRLIGTSLAACLLQAGEVEAGVIIVGTPAWQRLQAISAAVETPPESATQVKEDRPWHRTGSLGSTGASVPVVQTRRDDVPQAPHNSRPVAEAPPTQRPDLPPVRLPPPGDGGIFRPPEAVPATANVV